MEKQTQELKIAYLRAQIAANNAQNAYLAALIKEAEGEQEADATATELAAPEAAAISEPEPTATTESKPEPEAEKADQDPDARFYEPGTFGIVKVLTDEGKKQKRRVNRKCKKLRDEFTALGYFTTEKDAGSLISFYAEVLELDIPKYRALHEDEALEGLLKVARERDPQGNRKRFFQFFKKLTDVSETRIVNGTPYGSVLPLKEADKIKMNQLLRKFNPRPLEEILADISEITGIKVEVKEGHEGEAMEALYNKAEARAPKAA